MNKPPHPGTIVFVDETAGTEKSELASTVPDIIAFAQTLGGWAPAVRVVAVTHGNQRTLRSYGVDGALLCTTHQLRQP